MLMKATQAIFDDTALTKSVPRYPTDLWAGYGFSCSLPADLLKGILDISEENEVPEGRPILGRDAKTVNFVRIDMHAFLLLDEQNLKDIGVSTIGARKKIHHAIISKLYFI
ncbi:hypothetical protein ANCCEY_00262 [Ancylostoma ceylanicum]|uniref:SAM domain-containing protein n=1 Tax=Ancylostoma ceylanicum TaxID=53326 RepID=A0A0D6M952_9BILA|nr:hypothetical protein ANCCEY_00262 [Ancylostoma ceylanicum]